MQHYNLTTKQFWIIQNMWILEQSPVVFKLFCQEAEAVKGKNADAQTILQTWSWYLLNGRPNAEPKQTLGMAK